MFKGKVLTDSDLLILDALAFKHNNKNEFTSWEDDKDDLNFNIICNICNKKIHIMNFNIHGIEHLDKFNLKIFI